MIPYLKFCFSPRALEYVYTCMATMYGKPVRYLNCKVVFLDTQTAPTGITSPLIASLTDELQESAKNRELNARVTSLLAQVDAANQLNQTVRATKRRVCRILCHQLSRLDSVLIVLCVVL